MTGAISSPKRLSSSRHSPDLEHHHLSPSDIQLERDPRNREDTEDMASSPEGAKDGPWTEETKQKFNSKSKSEFYDPCQEAAQRSYRCLYRNNGDKSMCGEYFQAYRDCKQAWVEKRRKEKGTWF
ncbi:hypothetical protein HDV57DRAFT_388464 [Trichoderma longibrachiatum]|uniref:CHCH domain-containing protein n=1 Tax=Trichoderma longibrachiatum ATCC 18648 TaxID=983965 RepID=A0A2T4C418_TRILO|nr:hypothetical protein M440DRAFT_1401735 [Trichoderma longibrachiatum ATCC 18648]